MILDKQHVHRPDLNPSNAKLNPICHLLALLGAHHILHISRIRVKNCTYKVTEAYLCMSVHAPYC
jgi:hypothetical protein